MYEGERLARWIAALALAAGAVGCVEPTVLEPALRVQVDQLPPAARALEVSVQRSGQPLKRLQLDGLAGRQSASFGLWLPVDATGSLHLWLRARGEDGCVLAFAEADAPLTTAPESRLDVTMTAVPSRPAASCVRGLPQLDRVTPGTVPSAGGQRLTLLGAGLEPGTRVFIGGQEVKDVAFKSPGQLEVAAPALPGTLGPVPVRLLGTDGSESRRDDLLSYYTDTLRFAAKTFDAGTAKPQALALGDLDGDGDPDLAITSGNEISVLANLGDGRFAPRDLILLVEKAGQSQVAIADLAGNGRPSLLVSVPQTNVALAVLGNGGDGRFPERLRRSYQLGLSGGGGSVVLGDLRRSGLLDVVTHQVNGGEIVTLLNQGDGTFGPQGGLHDTATELNLAVQALVDLDQDGWPDLVSFDGKQSVSIRLNRRDGTFGVEDPDNPIRIAGGSDARCLGSGDLNGDGFPDLVIPLGNGSELRVVMNPGTNGSGRLLKFAEAKVYHAGASTACVAVADLNGDGAPDLTSVNISQQLMTVLLNRGDGTFPEAGQTGSFSVPSGLLPVQAVTGDVDGDGRRDVVVLNSFDGSVTVYRNTSD